MGRGKQKRAGEGREGKGALAPVTTTFWCKIAPLLERTDCSLLIEGRYILYSPHVVTLENVRNFVM